MYGAIDMLLSLFPIYLFSQVFIHLAFNRLTSKKLKIRKYCYRHSLCRISKQPASLLARTELSCPCDTGKQPLIPKIVSDTGKMTNE